MQYRNMALALITIVMLVAFYAVGASIGYNSVGFAGAAFALACLALMNVIKSFAKKAVGSPGVMAVQCTVGDK